MLFFLLVRFDSCLVLFAKYNRRLTCPLINQINEFIPWKTTYQQAIHKVSKAAKSYLKKKLEARVRHYGMFYTKNIFDISCTDIAANNTDLVVARPLLKVRGYVFSSKWRVTKLIFLKNV